MGVEKSKQIKVFNALGKLIDEKDLSIVDRKLQIDLANQANGIYFVEIIIDKEMIIKKIVKQ